MLHTHQTWHAHQQRCIITTNVYMQYGCCTQLGWGAAYLGKLMQARYKVGFYGIEYPGTFSCMYLCVYVCMHVLVSYVCMLVAVYVGENLD
jgi:hypothetical protein